MASRTRLLDVVWGRHLRGGQGRLPHEHALTYGAGWPGHPCAVGTTAALVHFDVHVVTRGAEHRALSAHAPLPAPLASARDLFRKADSGAPPTESETLGAGPSDFNTPRK